MRELMSWELDFPLRQMHAAIILKAPLTAYWVEHLPDCGRMDALEEGAAEACDCVSYTWFASKRKCVAVLSDGSAEEHWKN
jgi:hypothetical protein